MSAPPPAKRRRPKLTLAAPPKQPDELVAAEASRARLVSALDQLKVVAEDLPLMIEALATADEFEALLDIMGRLVDGRHVIDGMHDTASRAAMEIAPASREKFPIPGGGTFRVASGSRKKVIDHAGVQGKLAERLVDTLGLKGVVTGDGEVGEAQPLIRQIVITVCKATGAAVPSFTGWRSTILDELGVKLSTFTEWEDGPQKPVIEDR